MMKAGLALFFLLLVFVPQDIDARVFGWGFSSFLGEGAQVSQVSRTGDLAGRPVRRVSYASDGTINSAAWAVTSAGDLVAWGWVPNLFAGFSGPVKSPYLVRQNAAWQSVLSSSVIVDVSVCMTHGIALTASNDIILWGNNSNSQLGSSAPTDGSPRKDTGIPSRVVSIFASSWPGDGGVYRGVTVMLYADGTIVAMGSYSSGLFNGFCITPPCDLSSWTDISLPNSEAAIAIAVQSSHIVACGVSGLVYAWGSNNRSESLGAPSQPVFHNTMHSQQVVENSENIYCIRPFAGERNSGFISNLGSVYVWGSNSLGQLGVGSTALSVPVPTLVDLRGVYATQACVTNAQMGWMYILGLDSATGTSKVFSAGSNSNGILLSSERADSRSTIAHASTFDTAVQAPYDIDQLICKDDAASTISSSGSLRIWSLNNQARLLAAQRTSIPQPIDSSNTLLNKQITHMACSSGCAAAVYDSSAFTYSIYIWGVWEASSYGFEPSLLIALPANTTISDMVHCEAQIIPPFSAGVPYLLVLLSDGTVWSAGSNIDNNRGVASPTSEFTQITDINRYITKIACGNLAWAPVTSQLFIWGNSPSLGINNVATPTTRTITLPSIPNVIDPISGIYVSQFVGRKNAIVLLKDGSIYGLGDASNGEFCQPGAIYANPTKLTYSPGGTASAVSFAMGQGYTMVLLSNNTVLACGSNAFGATGTGAVPTPALIDTSNFNCSYSLFSGDNARAGEYVLGVTAGIDVTYIATNRNCLYAFGSNGSPQSRRFVLGTGVDSPYNATIAEAVKMDQIGTRRLEIIRGARDSAFASASLWLRKSIGQVASGTPRFAVIGNGFVGADDPVGMEIFLSQESSPKNTLCRQLGTTAQLDSMFCAIEDSSNLTPDEPLLGQLVRGPEVSQLTQLATFIATPAPTENTNDLPFNAVNLTITGTGFGTIAAGITVELTPKGQCQVAEVNETSLICRVRLLEQGLLNARLFRAGSALPLSVAVANVVTKPSLLQSDQAVPRSAKRITMRGTWLGYEPADLKVEFQTNTTGLDCPVVEAYNTYLICEAPSQYPTARGPADAVVYRRTGASDRARVLVIVDPPTLLNSTLPRFATNAKSIILLGGPLGTRMSDIRVHLNIVGPNKKRTNTTMACNLVSMQTELPDGSPGRITCQPNATLVVGDLHASIERNGGFGDEQYLGAIVPPPEVTARPTLLRATNAKFIEIQGSNFSPSPDESFNLLVFSGGVRGRAASATTSSINCEITSGLMPLGDLVLNITSNGGVALTAPVIAKIVAAPAVTPTVAVIDKSSTSLTIKGTGFNPTASENAVVVEYPAVPDSSAVCIIQSATEDTIVCSLPAGALNSVGLLSVTVTSNGGSTDPTVAFDVRDNGAGIQGLTSQGIGAIVGVLIAVVIAAIIAILVIRHKLQVRRDIRMREAVKVPDEMQALFNIKSADLQIINKLGEGSFGAVYFGKHKSRSVAIKKLAANMMASHISDFFREASLMLSIKPHKNVVRIFGMCQELNNFSMVMEFLPNGSLDSYVRHTLDEGRQVEPLVLYRIVRGVAQGMAHLASQGIVHRDLAARNILLDDAYDPRVSDFGFSRVVGSTGEGKTNAAVGPIKWMSPESIKDKQYSEKSDVWSFGVLLSEVLTGHEPYLNMDLLEIAVKIRDELMTPVASLPAGSPPYIVELMERIFKRDPEERPTFSEIVHFLDQHAPEGFVASPEEMHATNHGNETHKTNKTNKTNKKDKLRSGGTSQSNVKQQQKVTVASTTQSSAGKSNETHSSSSQNATTGSDSRLTNKTAYDAAKELAMNNTLHVTQTTGAYGHMPEDTPSSRPAPSKAPASPQSASPQSANYGSMPTGQPAAQSANYGAMPTESPSAAPPSAIPAQPSLSGNYGAVPPSDPANTAAPQSANYGSLPSSAPTVTSAPVSNNYGGLPPPPEDDSSSESESSSSSSSYSQSQSS